MVQNLETRVKREDTKIIRVIPKTHERLTKHGRKGETYNQIITRLIEEPEFMEKAEKVLEKANEAERIHQQDGKRTFELEQSFAEMKRLIEQFVNELKTR